MNPILQQAEDAVRAKSKAKGIDKVVQAGEGIMFSDGGAQLFKEQIEREGDMIENAAEGTAKLVGILFQQSHNTMPMDTAVAGGTILLYRGLDFLEEAGRIQITPEVVAQATKAFSGYVLQLFGVSQDKLQGMVAQAGQGQQATPAPAGLIGGAMQGGA